MKALIENRFGLLCLVLVALAAVYGVAHVTRPAPPSQAAARAVRAPVQAVSAVCPDPGGGRLSVITPSGGREAGKAVLTPVRAAREDSGSRGKRAAGTLATVERPGVLWQRTVPAALGPVAVAATGSMAPGLETAQTTRETSGPQRGLAGVRCTEPGSEAWFIGPGPAAANVLLYLANIDSAPAHVVLSIYSGEGPVLSDRDSSLILQPGRHRAIRLRDLAPTPLIMALRVSTTSGRVAAAVKAVFPNGQGVDWLPAAAPPSTRVVVPGIPSTAGQRELYVAAPGGQSTVVRVKAVLKDGSYALRNKESLEVPAESAATLDLTTGIGGQAAALVLESETPIVAGMKITGIGGAGQDVAFTAGATPIDIGSVVADGRASSAQSARLVLSAPFRGATVTVRLVPKEGPAPRPITVRIPAARTTEVDLVPPAGLKTGFSVVVQPQRGSGPVYGGRVLQEPDPQGLMITVQPLAVARTSVLVPPAVDSPSVVVR